MNPRILARALAEDETALTKYIVQSGQIEDQLTTANGLILESREVVAQLLTEREELKNHAGLKLACSWTPPPTGEEYNTWHGSCGADWCFEDGGPDDNQMKFCPECGGIVTVEHGHA